MFGRYVDQELDKAVRGAKSEIDQENRMNTRLRLLLREPDDSTEPDAVPKGMFKDPATMFGH